MQPVLVVRDERYALHLEKVPHIESPRRLRAIHEALDAPSLQGKWLGVKPREASQEELAWVHTKDYIERVARSAGKQLTSLTLTPRLRSSPTMWLAWPRGESLPF